jgi:hypothetical protein
MTLEERQQRHKKLLVELRKLSATSYCRMYLNALRGGDTNVAASPIPKDPCAEAGRLS